MKLRENHAIRNQMLYPAELRGQRGFPRVLPIAAQAESERIGTGGNRRAHSGHNLGHTPPYLSGSDPMVAALYVETDGCYYGLPGVDPWDEARDARLYAGPHPVVAHPPCQRWGRYWGGAPTTWPRLKLGDDEGCFEAALTAVRQFGGVLEHPEGSHAWRVFHLNMPPRSGGWVVADWQGGWTCCVEQGAYGHLARKATWLYANGVDLPSLAWGAADGDFLPMEHGFHSADERAHWKRTGEAPAYINRATKTGICQRLSKRQRVATPLPFRDLLLSIARTARTESLAA